MSVVGTVATDNVSDGEFTQEDDEEEEGEISTTPFPKEELLSDIRCANLGVFIINISPIFLI